MIALYDSGRGRFLVGAALASALVVGLAIAAWALGEAGVRPDFSVRSLPPSFAHPFGTDQMGRDMLARTVHGLMLSLRLGLTATALSVSIALVLAGLSGLGRLADALAGFVTDAALSIPHLLLLILISFALGGGSGAVIVAVAVSHWPRLARILRAELLQIRAAPYIETARGFGRSRLFILCHHVLPHLVPQMMLGVLLMFPHAILHEAALTFLGFGLEPTRPAIGSMLSEAMRHISAGRWWLALFPGVALVGLVLCFDMLANGVRGLTDPRQARI
ncbi:MAG: ABC transporter permease [Qingshengfaniella sp.]